MPDSTALEQECLEPRLALIHGGPHAGRRAPVSRFLSLPVDGGGRAEYGLVWVAGEPEWHFRKVRDA